MIYLYLICRGDDISSLCALLPIIHGVIFCFVSRGLLMKGLQDPRQHNNNVLVAAFMFVRETPWSIAAAGI